MMLRCIVRTTVTLPDDLYREAKVRAAAQDTSVGSVLEEALRDYLRRAASVAMSTWEPPTLELGGPLPGIDLDDLSSVEALLGDGIDARP